MCAQANNGPQTYEDSISSFQNGCNSGILPLLLDKNSLAFGTNVSLRGAYATHRPPIQKKGLTFQNSTVAANFQTGFFQGGGYYRPDYGTESLICQISGRLYQLIETNGIWNVTDISIPSDLNAATTGQVWMWQAEKWMIIQDGSGKLPIFFDGALSRRSYGPSKLLGVVTATTPAAPPAVGSIVTATLNAAYTGPLNVPVIFNEAFYQPTGSPTPGYQVQLTTVSLGDYSNYPQNQTVPVHPNIGDTVPIGSQLTVESGSVGYPVNIFDNFQTGSLPFSGPQTLTLPLEFRKIPENLQVGSILIIPGFQASVQWEVTSITQGFDPLDPNGNLLGTVYIVTVSSYFTYFADGLIPGYYLIQFLPPFSPNVTLGNTTATFVIPAIGDSIIITTDIPFTGTNGQLVWIGGVQYAISTPPGTPASTTLYIINLTDTTTTNYTFNQNIMSVPEINAGRMGAYGMGRNWWSQIDGISFEAGDIVGGAAGTPANNYRDAVLKTTENDFLSGGGSFRLPGTGDIINAMVFTANLDQSLGQGALQVGTDTTMFSVNTPVDRTTWETLTNPILTESLIGTGPLGQNSTVLVNSDVFFRSVAGLGDLVLARRNFGGWGNHPISNEMKRIIEKDNQTLLQYGSSVNFDNRFLTTCAPNVSSQGVFHIGLIAMNLDTISNLRTQLPPVYDGLWTGVNALQMIVGKVNGSVRSFAWTFNLNNNQIELWEFLPEKTAITQDNGTIPIVWTFESPVLFNRDVKPLREYVKLTNGELSIDEIVGTVSIEVQYRPDSYPCWTTWRKFSVCADPDTTVENSQPGYRSPIGLGEPDSSPCESGNNRPLRNGFYFQFRFVITGSCRFIGMRVEAVSEPRPKFAQPICDEVGQ